MENCILKKQKPPKKGGVVQAVLLGFLIFFGVTLGVFGVKAKLREAEKKVEIITAKMAEVGERFFYEGYDKGYQSAVVDIFLGEPLYMLDEDGGGGRLWKRVELDESNRKKIEEAGEE
jgi:hypothetical protein